MNPNYHQPHVPQQPYYAYEDLLSPGRSPWGAADQGTPAVIYYMPMPMPMFYPQSMQYADDVAIRNSMWVNQEPTHAYYQNQYYEPYQTPEDTFFNPSEFEAYLEERLIMLELEADHEFQRVTTRASGSGLSEEEISKHLHVYTAPGEIRADCEVDACSICLGEYEKKEKIGRIECGHRYHAECIKRWLLSKNVCPMCRSTALTVNLDI